MFPVGEVDDTGVDVTLDDEITTLSEEESVSVVLPSSLFIQITQIANDTNDNRIGVLFIAYESSVLFPIVNTNETNITVGAPVIGIDIVGFDVIGLTEPLTIFLRLNNDVSFSRCIYDNYTPDTYLRMNYKFVYTINSPSDLLMSDVHHMTSML